MILMSLGRCIISRCKLCEMDGYLAEEIEEERVAEVDRMLAYAEKLADKHEKWTAPQIMLMLDNSGTNMSFVEQDREMVEETVEGTPTPAGTVGTGKAATAKPA